METSVIAESASKEATAPEPEPETEQAVEDTEGDASLLAGEGDTDELPADASADSEHQPETLAEEPVA
jgi:hypothetical protein